MCHKKTKLTPYELWKSRKPTYKYLNVWGCLAKVIIYDPKNVKVEPKTVDCIFIGYAINSSVYQFLVHKSKNPNMHVNMVIELWNAYFYKDVFSCKIARDPSSSKRTCDVATNSYNETQNQEKEDYEPRHNKRMRTSKSFGPEFLTYMLDIEPRSFQEAMSTPEAVY